MQKGLARMILKMNNLEQKDMLELCYKANEAGVEVFIIIRECLLYLQANRFKDSIIKGISIVDRVSRAFKNFYFLNNGDEELFYFFLQIGWKEICISG